MTSDDVPEEYMDALLQEFAYDPVRLSPAEDPVQKLYNRRTLETIWVTNRDAVNPYTRLPFDINNAIPQSELRQEMCQYISKNGIPGLEVISDYTKVLTETEMKNLLKDLVYHYDCFSEIREKREEDWKGLWQKLNLIRLYLQYREENKKSFLCIKGYTYLFKVIDMHLCHSIPKLHHVCDDAKEVCRELVRIVDIIGLTLSELETIRGYSLKPFVSILSKLAHSTYLKIESMVLNIYSQLFYYGMGYVEDHGTLDRGVIVDALLMLRRENTIDITNEDLDNGTAVLRAAWLCDRDNLLQFADYVNVVVNVVILCISRFRENVAGENDTIGKALSRALKLIQYIVTEEYFEDNDDTYYYEYGKDSLLRLEIVTHLVQIVELVVAGIEFSPFHVEVALNIMTALCKSGLWVMEKDELRVLADFLASETVNKYVANVKILLQELINISSDV